MRSRTLTSRTPLLLPLVLLGACTSDPASDDSDGTDDVADGDSTGTEDTTDDGTTDDGGTPGDNPSCSYDSPFTQSAECRDYVGSAWSDTEVQADCNDLSGTVDLQMGCATDDVLGRCILDGGTEWEMQVVAYGTDASACDLQSVGCTTFGGGAWEPGPVCGGGGTETGGDENVFIQPSKVCLDPIDGEGPGQGPNGQICTWQAIAASTEEGRHYEDYADCEVVYSQRPYHPVPAAAEPDLADPRLDDPAYKAELDWVRSQVEASACACCHSPEVAPEGTSNWYITPTGNWLSTFYDSGLALGATWIDSTSFGAFPPEDNNGFDRIHSGVPSTDPDRMVAFFVAELEHRGRKPEDFANSAPFGGPLYQQMVFEPGPCENGEGVADDGTITWTGGQARYIYVLEAGADNPIVPPNLDLPAGTLWRVDVPWDGGTPISSGEISYGSAPAGMMQRYPEGVAPDALVPGEEYYLYVTRDVAIPITRCLFTY